MAIEDSDLAARELYSNCMSRADRPTLAQCAEEEAAAFAHVINRTKETQYVPFFMRDMWEKFTALTSGR